LRGLLDSLWGFLLLKFVIVTVAVQALLAYNTIIGRDIQEKYQEVNVIPDWVKTLVDDNVYQRYFIDPPLIAAYPAFYRKGFKVFSEDQYKYAISYDGTGKYIVYRKVRSGASSNKTKSVVEGKSEIKI
jgi:hypothetical protein